MTIKTLANGFRVTIFLLIAGTAPGALRSADAGDVFVEEVVQHVTAQDNAISDQTASVLVRQVDARGVERVSTHRLYWKNLLGDKGLIGKALLVTQTPLDKRGEGFLLWQMERANDSQAWLYLPDLRQVRRVAIAGHEHHEHGSRRQPALDLGFEQLGTRLVGTTGQLVGKEAIDGVDHLILDDRSTVTNDLLPLRRFWISFADWTIGKIEYRDATGRLIRTQRITWEHLDQGWVWKRTEIQPAGSSGKTIVELSDIAVNTGLADRLFTVENLKSGRLP
ncbi:MAG: outer membrane lipoprotein-sorting protein [Nitrospirota bacterium]